MTSAIKKHYNFTLFLESKAFCFLFFMALFIVNLPFLFYYAESYTTTLAKFTCDEVEFLFNIDLILEQIALGKPLSAAYNLYTFGYGSVYWGISALVAAPCWLYNSEYGVVISLRLLSLLCSLGSLFIMFKLLSEHTTNIWFTYFSLLFCFFSPIVITYANMIHPESLFCFFLVLAFYLLHRDNHRFQRYYHGSLFAFALAISTKLIATLFGIVYIIHFIHNRKRISYCIVLKSLLMGLLFFMSLNIFSGFPLIGNRFIGWVTHESKAVMYGLDLKTTIPLLTRFAMFSDNYINSYLCILLIIISVYSIYKHKNFSASFLFFSGNVVALAYVLFCLFYSYMPYHYGIALMYFLPITIASVMTMVDKNIPKRIIVIIVLVLCNSTIFTSATRILLNPAGSIHNQAIYKGLESVAHFMTLNTTKITSLGISSPLRPPHVYRRKMRIQELSESTETILKDIDVIIIWKKNNQQFNEKAFEKIYEDHEIKAYKKN